MNARTRHLLLRAVGVRPGADPEMDQLERAGWLRRVKAFHPRYYGDKRPERASDLVEVYALTCAGEDVLAGDEPANRAERREA